ncbi:isochorismatase family cysteine hydrolase [Thiohalophilus sp.]|uniref:cysteine hydrolase family protein n=1 Tax=Thiohalophilus sp. TaxID=3028392 RepID=UPI002ACE7672|nr:isochorismatase family cysteine hydrolase [Thiohalophilus sp.]MDZ7804923.1 isochorismatase family cysteine hydrolase [Thiohalophilus sp.]
MTDETFDLSEDLDLNPEFLDVDPLEEKYRASITPVQAIQQSLEEHHTALLVIDLQYLDAARGYGVFENVDREQMPHEAEEFYFDSLENTVLPNVRRLQDTFRANKLEVIHIRIQSLTRDGRDRSPGHKRLGLHAAPGSREAEFIPEVAPVGDEIVINKSASGVFNATNLEYVLRNMGVTGLFVCGVYTNECVSTTIRDASDLGFYTTLIADGCTTVTPELHTATIRTVKDRYSRVMTTDDAIKEINKVVA